MTKKNILQFVAASQQGIIISINLNLLAPPPQRQNWDVCRISMTQSPINATWPFRLQSPVLEPACIWALKLDSGHVCLQSEWSLNISLQPSTVSHKTTCSEQVNRSLPRMTGAFNVTNLLKYAS